MPYKFANRRCHDSYKPYLVRRSLSDPGLAVWAPGEWEALDVALDVGFIGEEGYKRIAEVRCSGGVYDLTVLGGLF